MRQWMVDPEMLTDKEIWEALGYDHPPAELYLADARKVIAAYEAKLREQKPVEYQRRALHEKSPGAVNKWEPCSVGEATNSFDRSPFHEYRKLYLHPAPIPEAELKEAIRIGAEYAFNLTGLNEGLTIEDKEIEKCYKAMLAAARGGE